MAANCIGIDIGATSVKIAQIKERRGSLTLMNFGVHPLPPETIVEGSIMNQAAVVDAIHNLYDRLGIRSKDVAMAVGGRSVIVKKISMPKMSVEELAEELDLEMEHHIPFARDEVEVDFDILEEENEEGQMNVMLVAAKKEVVQDYQDLALEAGINLRVLDVAAFAVQNLYEKLHGFRKDELVILMNIGAQATSLNMVVGGVSTFVRDVGIGVDSVIGEIQRSMGLAREAAAAKLNEISSGMSPDAKLMDTVKKVTDVMAGEYQRSIEFFMSSIYTSLGSKKLVISGGGAMLKPLVDAITSRAGMETMIFDPFAGGLKVPEKRFDIQLLKQHATSSVVALGLALRKPGDKR